MYPSNCVWPHSLVTIALNSALHNEANVAVPGPFKKLYSMSRYKFFLWSFGAMFIYFWFPNYLFEVLTFFSWMTWIAPENHTLEILASFKNGLGVSSYHVRCWAFWLSDTYASRRCSTRSLLSTATSCCLTTSILW